MISNSIDTKGRPVIFYGAGHEAFYEVAKYKKKGIAPVCFCDRDSSKWGTKFLGFDCVSLEQAVKQYPDFLMVVTPRYPLRFHIMEDLMSWGTVTKDQLLNYEPWTKRKSCYDLCGYVDVHYSKRLLMCCSCDSVENIHQSPCVEFKENIANSMNNFRAHRDNILNGLNGGTEEDAQKCSSCRWAIEDYWPVDQRFRRIAYSVGGGCQFNCSYCTSVARHTIIQETWEKDAAFPEVMDYLERNNLIHPDAVIEIGTGEICVAPRRDEILNVTSNYYTTIFTNAGIYNEQIAEQIESGNVLQILVSIDAGTRETFQKVKGVDAFENIRENLKKYRSYGSSIDIKFVFLPGINDNEEDVDGFVALAKELGVREIGISRNFEDGFETMPKQTLNMIQRMIVGARKNGISVCVLTLFFSRDDAALISTF